MKIFDKEYGLKLSVKDYTGREIYTEVFEDFEGLNRFIQTSYMKPEFDYIEASYTLVVKNGDSYEPCCDFCSDIEPFGIFCAESIKDELDDIMEVIKKCGEQATKTKTETSSTTEATEAADVAEAVRKAEGMPAGVTEDAEKAEGMPAGVTEDTEKAEGMPADVTEDVEKAEDLSEATEDVTAKKCKESSKEESGSKAAAEGATEDLSFEERWNRFLQNFAEKREEVSFDEKWQDLSRQFAKKLDETVGTTVRETLAQSTLRNVFTKKEMSDADATLISELREDAYHATKEVIEASHLEEGDLLVVGCSTSEISGAKIGSDSKPQLAQEVFLGIWQATKEAKVSLAAQCCEHLNRALILEKKVARERGYERVNVVPQPKAGGSFATMAYKYFEEPVAVEHIKADAGMDIGDTFIGMHMKEVAVPLRISYSAIGEAHLTCIRIRPKFIGGERACYDKTLM